MVAFHSVGRGFPLTTSHSASTHRLLYLTSIVGSFTFTLLKQMHYVMVLLRIVKTQKDQTIITYLFSLSVSATTEDYHSQCA